MFINIKIISYYKLFIYNFDCFDIIQELTESNPYAQQWWNMI